jgi:glyoxylase-like metal-dependent hydrolase (beta-lactamase superfamily II)
MITLASGLSYLDLRFRGVPGIIATAVVHGPGGVALVDPGPSSTLPVLRRELEQAGIAIADVNTLLLTHIHLDHAGATGTLVRENPSLRVYVHERGAPHMINPERLVASATMLYGDAMERLWGEVRPVPAAAIVSLAGGERIGAGGRDFDVAYTPGHASHHVSYFSRESGVAFVGDTAGVRLREGGLILPPTPPPDIDLELWRASLARIGEWMADTLFITHFGPSAPTAPHLSEMADRLEMTAALVKESLAHHDSDTVREAWFTDRIRALLQQRSAQDAYAYEVAGRFDLNWRGLARYWRKKGLTP